MTELARIDGADAKRAADLISPYVSHVGIANAPRLAAFVAAILSHRQTSSVIVVDGARDDVHPALVSHSEAAAYLDRSLKTIGRWVRNGDLDPVGNSITWSSIERLVASGSARGRRTSSTVMVRAESDTST